MRAGPAATEAASLCPPRLLGLLTAPAVGNETFRLWERILADNAKAEFIVAGIGKPREGGASYYLM